MQLAEFIDLDPTHKLEPSEGIWIATLQGEGKSPRTLRSYNETAVQLRTFLEDRNLPTDVESITKPHLSAYITHVLSKHSTSTAGLRYRSLSVLFNFLVTDGWLDDTPMRTMQHPKQEQKVVPVVALDDLAKLVQACEGSDFADRRDHALVSFLIDTGVRVGELVGIREPDIDLKSRSVLIRGKGSKQRTVTLGPRAYSSLLKYRSLRKQKQARSSVPEMQDTPMWWIGDRSPLTTSGVTQILRRRCAQAGIERIRPHQLRHTFAHVYLATGGREGDLMHEAGWSSRTMLDRYGASAASERARASHAQHSPLEQL